MTQPGILRRSLGWLATIVAALLIVLAVLVGLVRLLLPLAPDYQEEVRRFATDATGFDVHFGRLTASWPLRGPEVRFFDVRIATLKNPRLVLEAQELSVGINLWRLVVERRWRPNRVAIDGASVKAEHLPSGEWLINAVPLDEILRRPRNQPLPHLELELQNIELLLLDAARLESRVGLQVEKLNLDVGPNVIGFDAEVDGRDSLGSGIEVSGTLPVPILESGGRFAESDIRADTAWNVQVIGTDLDVARWLRVVGNETFPLTSGRGDMVLQFGFSGKTPKTIAVDLELGPTVWQGITTAANNYRRLELQGSWTAIPDGWEVALGRFVVERGTKTSPASTGTARYSRSADGPGTLSTSADNIRLQDLWPLLWSIASTGLRRDLLPERVQGEVDKFELTASLPAGQPPTYEAEATFRELGLVMPVPGWAVTGVSGSVRANQTGGSITLNSSAGLLRFPKIFRADIRTTATTGMLGWKHSERGLEVLGDELRIATPDGESQSRARLLFPRAGSIFVDVATNFVASSAPAALNYLPLMKLKPGAVKWLDAALVAGTVPQGELLWQGPLRGFPYEAGDGRFRAEFALADAVIDYSADWPRLENVSGTVIVDRVSLTSLDNRGSIGGIPFANAEFRVANLIRDTELDVLATNQVELGQILNFLRQTPVAAVLGPTLETVTGSGEVAAAIDLRLPIANLKDYRLAGTFGLDGARLGLRGVEFGLTALQGTVRLDSNRLESKRLSARFLDEPVSIELRPAHADEFELTQVANVRGETPAGKLAAAFSLPYADRLAGNVAWDATVRVPARRSKRPATIQITSDLDQFSSTLAPPLTKVAGMPEPLRMEVTLPDRGLLQVTGAIERGVSWALQFQSGPRIVHAAAPNETRRTKASWRLERGALRSGSVLARLPTAPGVEIGGNFASLRFEDWFSGRSAGGSAGEASARNLIREIDIEADSFAVFGRVFRNAHLEARRASGGWQVAVHGPSAVGAINVPVGQADDVPIVFDMQRLWLLEADPAVGDRAADPRNLPPIRASIDDFALKDMRFGRLSAELAQRGDGVVVDPILMESPTFQINGDATWVVEGNDISRQRSELRLRLQSKNIGVSMQALGYDRVVEGEKASVTLDLFWPAGPSEDFLNAAGGRVLVNLDNGHFLPVDPGGGRLVGLLSIAMLPRRLGLDFSDVVDKGLAFDQVKGEFRLDKGQAFTCNFGLEGPATDIGIVGRTSLRDRSYDQLAVARPHVSDVLAVGGFVGGPVVGGTVLLISQIFRKPLSSFGESYYRISGGWDHPVIKKVQKSEVDVTPFRDCERYLAEALKDLPQDVKLTP